MGATIRQRARQSWARVAVARVKGVRLPQRRLLLALALMVTCAVAIANTDIIKGHGTTTTLKITAKGNVLTLTAMVSPSNATGTVTFQSKSPKDKTFADLGKSSLKAGVASWTFDDGSGKALDIRAVYNGSKTYAASTSKTKEWSCDAGPDGVVIPCRVT
jgi:hypothetical protein